MRMGDDFRAGSSDGGGGWGCIVMVVLLVAGLVVMGNVTTMWTLDRCPAGTYIVTHRADDVVVIARIRVTPGEVYTLKLEKEKRRIPDRFILVKDEHGKAVIQEIFSEQADPPQE